MRAAAIDVGTNSIKYCVGERAADGVVRILRQGSANPRLGEGVDESKALSPESMDRAVHTIGEQLAAIREMGADRVRLAGTSAVRDASNREDLVNRLQNELGVTLEVLSEFDEARLSYLAIARDPELGGPQGSQIVVDVGGGSTEFIHGEGDWMGFTISVKVGAVRLTERFLKGDHIDMCRLADAGTMAERLLADVAEKVQADRFVGVGGSVVNLARIWKGIPIEQTEDVHALRMSYRDLRRVIDLLVNRTVEERKQLVGLESERADVIVAGAVILDRALALFEQEEMTISIRGLRHGLIYEMLAEE